MVMINIQLFIKPQTNLSISKRKQLTFIRWIQLIVAATVI